VFRAVDAGRAYGRFGKIDHRRVGNIDHFDRIRPLEGDVQVALLIKRDPIGTIES